jgi:hypothetical protein
MSNNRILGHKDESWHTELEILEYWNIADLRKIANHLHDMQDKAESSQIYSDYDCTGKTSFRVHKLLADHYYVILEYSYSVDV